MSGQRLAGVLHEELPHLDRVALLAIRAEEGICGGRVDSQGAEVHRKSDADSVLPGIRPGANIAKDSSR